MTDEELVELIIAGDKEAWGTLVRRWETPLLNYLSTWSSYHIAQEILQDTWVAAYKGIAKGHRPRKWGAWIFTIAHRLIINNHYRNKEERHCNLTHDVTDHHQDAQDTEWVDAALKELDDGSDYAKRKVDCVRGFYWEAKSIAELADELNLPKGTVKRTLHTAKKELATILTRINDPGE